LFKDPDSPRAQKIIGELEELYREVNEATGTVNLDSMLGLLMNENRPDGFAITNEGFQTFVLEASARIMKQAMLTTHWHPNDVGWTAINLVEAISKEKLIAFHCRENPEISEYLEDRHKPISFNDMSTDQESPLQAFMDFSGERFHDMGLGDPWKEEHFTGNGLDEHYLTRVTHAPSGEKFVVDVTEGRVYQDTKGDGRVRAYDAMANDAGSVSRDELLAAATALRESGETTETGTRSASHPDFVGGERLTEDETRRLKQWKGDKRDRGVELEPREKTLLDQLMWWR
ncbi:MAG: hypothetical protein AAF658_08290, partial [Myxococcota bacterium]